MFSESDILMAINNLKKSQQMQRFSGGDCYLKITALIVRSFTSRIFLSNIIFLTLITSNKYLIQYVDKY